MTRFHSTFINIYLNSPSNSSPYTSDSIFSQLTLYRLNQLLNIRKLIVVIQATRVHQSAGRLDTVSRHNLLDRKLDLFEIDRRWDLRGLENVLWNVSLAQLTPNRILHILDDILAEFVARCHHQEEEDCLIVIGRPSLADADTVGDLGHKLFDNVIYFCGAKSHTRRIQDTICSTEEEDLFGDWMHHDEVAVSPDI